MENFGLNSTHSKDMIDIYKRVADVRRLEMVYFKDKFATNFNSFDLMKYGTNIYKKE
jgi:hypothetical protein